MLQFELTKIPEVICSFSATPCDRGHQLSVSIARLAQSWHDAFAFLVQIDIILYLVDTGLLLLFFLR